MRSCVPPSLLAHVLLSFSKSLYQRMLTVMFRIGRCACLWCWVSAESAGRACPQIPVTSVANAVIEADGQVREVCAYERTVNDAHMSALTVSTLALAWCGVPCRRLSKSSRRLVRKQRTIPRQQRGEVFFLAATSISAWEGEHSVCSQRHSR